jgi:hypothetical protein
MYQKRQFGWAIGGVCLTVMGVGLFWPEDRSAGLERSLVRPLPRVLDAETNRAANLDKLLAVSRGKQALKNEVVEDLFAGRVTLAQAVARCQEIEELFLEQAPQFRRSMEKLYPDACFEECLARNLFTHCRALAQVNPERDPDGVRLARLESELASYVRSLA